MRLTSCSAAELNDLTSFEMAYGKLNNRHEGTTAMAHGAWSRLQHRDMESDDGDIVVHGFGFVNSLCGLASV